MISCLIKKRLDDRYYFEISRTNNTFSTFPQITALGYIINDR